MGKFNYVHSIPSRRLTSLIGSRRLLRETQRKYGEFLERLYIILFYFAERNRKRFCMFLSTHNLNLACASASSVEFLFDSYRDICRITEMVVLI